MQRKEVHDQETPVGVPPVKVTQVDAKKPGGVDRPELFEVPEVEVLYTERPWKSLSQWPMSAIDNPHANIMACSGVIVKPNTLCSSK